MLWSPKQSNIIILNAKYVQTLDSVKICYLFVINDDGYLKPTNQKARSYWGTKMVLDVFHLFLLIFSL